MKVRGWALFLLGEKRELKVPLRWYLVKGASFIKSTKKVKNAKMKRCGTTFS